MKCTQARMLLHLDRPGERSSGEQVLLDHHLHRCATCRALEQQMNASAALCDATLRDAARAAAGAAAAQADPDRSLDRIMSAVAHTAQLPPRHDHTVVPLQGLQRLAESAVLRYAIAAALVLMAGGFLYQTWTLQRDVAALERIAAASGTSSPTVEVGYSVDTRSLRSGAPVSEGLPLPAADADGTLFLTKAEADELLRQASLPSRLPLPLSHDLDYRSGIPHAATFIPAISLRIAYTGV